MDKNPKDVLAFRMKILAVVLFLVIIIYFYLYGFTFDNLFLNVGEPSVKGVLLATIVGLFASLVYGFAVYSRQ